MMRNFLCKENVAVGKREGDGIIVVVESGRVVTVACEKDNGNVWREMTEIVIPRA